MSLDRAVQVDALPCSHEDKLALSGGMRDIENGGSRRHWPVDADWSQEEDLEPLPVL